MHLGVAVLVIGVLILGMSVFGGPRPSDDAGSRSKDAGMVRSDATQWVTGSPDRLQAVVAGALPTAVMKIVPVAAKVGTYPSGTTIVGNELRASAGGFRAWFEFKLSHWDPEGDNVPPLYVWQFKIDGSGFLGANAFPSNPGVDLTPPVIACGSHAVCATAFGEAWARCEGGFCRATYVDRLGTGRVDSWCADTGSGSCDQADCEAINPLAPRCISIYPSGVGRPDAGIDYYGATVVLDIPAGAMGKYTVNLNTDETFLADTGVPPNDIPTLAETGFAVNIVTGSCCFGLGTPGPGCADDLTQGECDALPAPRVFRPGGLCANPPTADGCVECIVQGNDPLCNDNDACTTETCNAAIGLCIRGNVAGWDTANECCNPANGAQAPKDDGNPCTNDACSLDPTSGTPKPGNGVPTHTPSSSSTPCDDNNPCTTADHCVGPPSTACTGTNVNSILCATSADCPLDPTSTPYSCVNGFCFCPSTACTPLPPNDSDKVIDYACNCYKRMGITAADVKRVVGNGMDKINCKAAGKGIIKQLYTTEKCPKPKKFTTVGQADCKVRDIKILEGKCTGDAAKKCLGDADCDVGPCNMVTQECTEDATKTCTENEQCNQGPCINFAFQVNPNAMTAIFPATVPTFPADCDRTAWLSDKCYGNTYIHKWDINSTDPANSMVTIALLCRHRTRWSDGDDDFDDIAMIMHNDKSGQTCWFQSPSGPSYALDGRVVPVPHAADALYDPATHKGWYNPSVAAEVNCIYCHDNGPWMNSRWLFNSGIDLEDENKPYLNKGFAFKDWKEPKFVTVDTAGLKDADEFDLNTQQIIKHFYTKKSCTSCHKIHSGESGLTVPNSIGVPPEGGNSLKKWIKYTVGQEFPDNSNATGQQFPDGGPTIAYWMPPIGKTCTGGVCNGTGQENNYDVYAADTGEWEKIYKKHVDALLICAKGGVKKEDCEEAKKKANAPLAAASETPSLPPCVCPDPGTFVCLCADTNNDGVWDTWSAAPSDGSDCTPLTDPPCCTPLTDPPSCRYPVSTGTPLSVGWSSNVDHPNCFIATTFPAGVKVTDTMTMTSTGTGSNWLLSENSQRIGILDVSGDYYFHIDCDDDDYGQITASLTFQIAGQPPTVLRVHGIVNGAGKVAFDYPACPTLDCEHADIPVDPAADVDIGWIAYNIDFDEKNDRTTCVLSETFTPSGGHTPFTPIYEESGFLSVPVYNNTDQKYTLTCTGDDGQPHSVDVTIRAVSPSIPTWNSGTLSPDRTTRALRFTVEPPVTATGSAGQSAIKVTMIDLQHPRPANQPANAPPNFTTFDTRTNGVCNGGSLAGHHCDTDADCPPGVVVGRCSGLVACTGDPVCTDPLKCTLPSNSCTRWVGKLGTFLESQADGAAGGTYRAARLQCTPYYHDWTTEGPFTVVGAEIAPSSEYSVQAYSESCKGAETGCTNVSDPVTMVTRRSGDAGLNFNPPATTDQPDALDIAQVVNKLKGVPGSLVKSITQQQPNLPELNADINALDIAAVVDALKFAKYAFSGPCPCPSTVTCGLTSCATASTCAGIYGAESTCVKTCTGGTNAGDPCINDTHCPGSTCSAGYCRDRCGRCTP